MIPVSPQEFDRGIYAFLSRKSRAVLRPATRNGGEAGPQGGRRVEKLGQAVSGRE
jgi:hypothetical protein